MTQETTTSDSFRSAVRLAAAVGRLRVASNLKAVADAQAAAFMAAGEAAGGVHEAEIRERPAQVGRLREAVAALARCRAWIHVIAELTNQPVDVFGEELGMVDHAERLVLAKLQTLDRGEPRPPRRDGRGPRDARPEQAAPRPENRPRPPGRGRGTSQPGGLR